LEAEISCIKMDYGEHPLSLLYYKYSYVCGAHIKTALYVPLFRPSVREK